jgi:hypothetical protein
MADDAVLLPFSSLLSLSPVPYVDEASPWNVLIGVQHEHTLSNTFGNVRHSITMESSDQNTDRSGDEENL